jgi:hypothetical protein
MFCLKFNKKFDSNHQVRKFKISSLLYNLLNTFLKLKNLPNLYWTILISV